MLFSSIFITVKNEDETDGIFMCAKCWLVPTKVKSPWSCVQCGEQGILLSCQEDGGWSKGGAPVIARAVLVWNQFEKDEDVTVAISICDSSVL